MHHASGRRKLPPTVLLLPHIMKRILFFALLAFTALSVSQAEDAVAPKLESIFNGKDLTGWKAPAENPFWKVVDGVLVGENDEKKKGSMLYSEKSYQDVIVEAEVRWQGEIDSGIMLRKPEIQMQIGVSRSLKKDMTCAVYIGNYPEEGRGKGVDKLLKIGEWNKMRFQAKGNTFTIWLNGEKVTEYTNDKYPGAGPIGLQIHGGLAMKVEFKNIQAKALDEAPAK